MIRFLKEFNDYLNEEPKMFNKLFSMCHSIVHFQSMMGDITSLLNNFDDAYLKDESLKNAAIDTVIEILQAHKDPLVK